MPRKFPARSRTRALSLATCQTLEHRTLLSWTLLEIGTVTATSSYTGSATAGTLVGGGQTISNSGPSDNFTFLYDTYASGDATITARILSVSATNTTARSGIMIRNGLTTDAKSVYLGFDQGKDLSLIARDTTAGNAREVQDNPDLSTPWWLRLVRQGNVFKTYTSYDGSNWGPHAEVTLTMTGTIYLGLAVSSNWSVSTSPNTTVYDSVSYSNSAVIPALGNVRIRADFPASTVLTTKQSFGLNIWGGLDATVAQNTSYQSNLAYMKPGLIRYHAAEQLRPYTQTQGWLDTADRDGDGYTDWYGPTINTALNATKNLGADRLVTVTGWTSQFDTNNDGKLDTDKYAAYGKWVADLVRIMNVTYGQNIKYLEPFNEKDDRVDMYNTAAEGTELGQVYNAVVTAVKAVDPNIIIGGGSFREGWNNTVFTPFMQATAPNLGFVSYHQYGTGSSTTTDFDIYESAQNASSHIANMRSLTNGNVSATTPLFIDEYNIYNDYTLDTTGKMRGMKGAVFSALYVADSVRTGSVAGTALWNDRDGTFGTMDTSYVRRPTAHLLNLLNNFFIGRVAVTSTSERFAVDALSVENGTARVVMLINRSTTSRTVNLDLAGWTPPSSTYNDYALTSSSTPTATTRNTSGLASGVSVAAETVRVLVFPYDSQPTVTARFVGDGSAQRSLVKYATYTFSSPVTVGPGAFTLTRTSDSQTFPVTASNPSGDGTTWLVSVTGGLGVTSQGLPDGRYQLTFSRTQITDAYNFPISASSPNLAPLTFHRFFGDYDGNTAINNADLLRLRRTQNKSLGDPGYLAYFDFDGNNTVNATDVAEFMARYGKILPTAPASLSAATSSSPTVASSPQPVAAFAPIAPFVLASATPTAQAPPKPIRFSLTALLLPEDWRVT